MDMFSALADPTRRDILQMLSNKGQLKASDIYKKFDTSSPAISQHLKVLKTTRLVTVEKKAQQRLYRINPRQMIELEKWIQQMTHHWEESFDRLEKVLKKEQQKK